VLSCGGAVQFSLNGARSSIGTMTDEPGSPGKGGGAALLDGGGDAEPGNGGSPGSCGTTAIGVSTGAVAGSNVGARGALGIGAIELSELGACLTALGLETGAVCEGELSELGGVHVATNRANRDATAGKARSGRPL